MPGRKKNSAPNITQMPVMNDARRAALVRDAGIESTDEPPATLSTDPLVPAHQAEPPVNGDDLRRAYSATRRNQGLNETKMHSAVWDGAFITGSG